MGDSGSVGDDFLQESVVLINVHGIHRYLMITEP